MLPDTQEFISCLLRQREREREQGKEQKRFVDFNLKECGVKGKKQGHHIFVFLGEWITDRKKNYSRRQIVIAG